MLLSRISIRFDVHIYERSLILNCSSFLTAEWCSLFVFVVVDGMIVCYCCGFKTFFICFRNQGCSVFWFDEWRFYGQWTGRGLGATRLHALLDALNEEIFDMLSPIICTYSRFIEFINLQINEFQLISFVSIVDESLEPPPLPPPWEPVFRESWDFNTYCVKNGLAWLL